MTINCIRRFLILFLMVLSFRLMGQTYIGTMKVEDYTRENVEVKLARGQNGSVVMTMYKVKFSRLMPVKIDVEIPSLSLKGTVLQGNDIIPTSSGKKYEKYTIYNLNGAASSSQLDFTCLMGTKHIAFKGRRK